MSTRRNVAIAVAAAGLGGSVLARAQRNRDVELGLAGVGVMGILVALAPEPKKKRKAIADAPTLEPSTPSTPSRDAEPQPVATPLRIYVQRSGGSSPAVLLVDPTSSGWRAQIAKSRLVTDTFTATDRKGALRRALDRFASNIGGHDTLLLSFYPATAVRGVADVWHARIAPGVGSWSWQVNAAGSNTAAGSSGTSPDRGAGVLAALGFVERQGQ